MAQSKAKKTAKKEAKKFAKKHKKGLFLFVIVVLVIVVAVIGFLYFFKPDTFDFLLSEYQRYTKMLYNDSPDDDPEGTRAKVSEAVPEGSHQDISTAQFSIHFLELGNKYAGDCTLIKCGDVEVLIDAGSRTNSAETIKAYVDQYCTDGVLEYVIATHAHQDHIAGFVGSGTPKNGILYEYSVNTLIQFSGHNTTSGIYTSYVSAVEQCKKADGTKTDVFTAKDCWYETGGAKRSYALSEDGALTLNVLYQKYYETETKDENDYSVCVLLSYAPAGGEASHYLFTGDLEGAGEKSLLESNTLPEVDLFKGAHHGSKTSSTPELMKVIKPKNVAVCCCAGAVEYTKTNDNTFPTQKFIENIKPYTENVYVTSLCIDYDAGKFESMNGNIVFYVSAGKLNLWCSNNTTILKDTAWFAANRVWK